jgi:hypothetical protein
VDINIYLWAKIKRDMDLQQMVETLSMDERKELHKKSIRCAWSAIAKVSNADICELLVSTKKKNNNYGF